MRRVAVGIASAWLALAAGAGSAAPLEAYGKLPTIQAVSISPGGESLAMIVSDGEQRKVLVQDLQSGRAMTVPAGAIKVRAIDWAGPRHLIISASKTTELFATGGYRVELMEAFDLNLDARKIHPLLGDVSGALNAVIDRPEVRVLDGKPVVFLRGVSYRGWTVFRVDLESERSRISESSDGPTEQVALGPDGHVLAMADYQSRQGRWTLKVKQSSGWAESRSIDAPNDHPEIAGLGRDGSSVLVAELRDGEFVYREVSVPTGAWSEALPMSGSAWPLFDPADRRLIGYVALNGDELHHEFFDPKDRAIWAAITKLYPGQIVHLVSWSADRTRTVVLVDSPSEGPAYALVDLGKHTATWLGGQYGALTASDIAPVRSIRFNARDGLELHGYLTLPRGVEAKGLPLVVLPHGGPAVRDAPGFDWWAQALASRGYAVLKVNFRGSGGLGWDFLKAGFGQWGRKMQTDLSDGVRYLAVAGIVDPKRVCIVGASYGGYAALAGATLEPDVYRCAVSYAGMSDMPRMVDWTGGYEGERYLLRFTGARSRNDDALSAISPALHADKVRIPILLMHGRDDTNVPLDQSYYMANALKRAGKPVEFQIFDGTDHGLSKGETRLQMLQATVAFLEKHNPPQ